MKLVYQPRFRRDYQALPPEIKRRADKQIQLLEANPRHHSLRARKMEGYPDIYEARVTQAYRLTYSLTKDVCSLRRIGTHDILETP